MLEWGSLDAARASRMPRTLRTGEAAWVGVVVGPAFGTLPPGAAPPQCFLVQQSPGSSVLPHFHPCDQFQLVVEGSGRIGSHEVRPFALHYARRHTGYGPVLASAAGLSYLSIRAEASWATHYLPESRELLPPGPRLNLFAPPVAPLAQGVLQALDRERRDVVLAHEDAGELAWRSAAPPGHAFGIDAGGGVLFGLVLAGAVHAAGEVLGAGACLCLHGAPQVQRFTAGASGSQLLWMRFAPPRPSIS